MTGGKVVVLGKTGRNFAAGMSGGIAYVYDPKKNFVNGLCNMEMVELENPSATDAQELFELIQNHYHATESTKALMILENWDKQMSHFVKVIPTDYKKALARIEEEKAAKQTV
jgi:glutamate synthase (ferredoxin)